MVRMVGPTGDEADANERLNWQMRVLRSMVAHDDQAGTPDIACPGSELAEDDRTTAPFHTSHLVHYALSVASDALRTPLILMDESGTSFRDSRTRRYRVLSACRRSSSGARVLTIAPHSRRCQRTSPR
jgi:hypothetical protein